MNTTCPEVLSALKVEFESVVLSHLVTGCLLLLVWFVWLFLWFGLVFVGLCCFGSLLNTSRCFAFHLCSLTNENSCAAMDDSK